MSTNTEYIKRLKQGDEKALKIIFEDYYNYLLVVGNRYLRDQHRVEDVIQDIFLDLWKRKETLEISSELKMYLRGAMVNKCLNIIRKENKIDLVDETHKLDQVSNTTEETLDLRELKMRLANVIASLPEKCREVFELSRVEQLSHKEIAAKLNISTKTIENHMTRALKTLRSKLGNKNAVYILFVSTFYHA